MHALESKLGRFWKSKMVEGEPYTTINRVSNSQSANLVS